ncbi:hypothetical protein GCM10027275_19930 [Rhabdobacter roseus]|uniref:SAM-dependent methyltransferase n=1 Tax=Rhabdobacter roseus TaxID=1655419 RepID=A0A840TRQ9_9BACT|nr:class I SAM-dependent methyltransferase [Rhabdobacter roseus]MBB5283923.1 SAM-dependent methyltransferase [Rhabdobacter roseus]
MWGFEPARSAVLVRDFFAERGVRQVLIPGIGYGRNAQVFRDSGMAVTGIEISQTAIEIARKQYGPAMAIYHGSVTDMPFDHNRYDGIFCYALIHLLDRPEREKLIRDCYHQLTEQGYMVFTVLSKAAPTYGQGTYLSPDRFEMFGGVQLFFLRPRLHPGRVWRGRTVGGHGSDGKLPLLFDHMPKGYLREIIGSFALSR